MSSSDKETHVYVAHEEYVPFDPSNPEKNLLRAVLLSALSDLRKPGEASRRAREYLLSPDDDYLFAFQSICSYLQVDANKILGAAGLRGGSGVPLVTPTAPALTETAQGEIRANGQPESNPLEGEDGNGDTKRGRGERDSSFTH